MPNVKKINPFFKDDRGEMFHLLENNASINSVLLISCKKGSIRANHFHKKDGHYSYILKGKMEYFYRDGKETKVRKILVTRGEIIFTPPNEVHAMKFLEDSLFLALATENRDKKSYEKDTVRVKLI